jgi:Na+-transporting methylmalonyl-CoA/oxaloacetate decarboxylase gamma subunit
MPRKLTTTFVILVFLILFFAGMSAVTGNNGDSPEMIGQQETIDSEQWLQPFSFSYTHIKG